MKPETKIKLVKAAQITLWSILVSGLVVCLGFVEKQEEQFVCKSLNISINQDYEEYFVQKEDITQILHNRGDSIIHQPVSSINIPAIENILNSHAAIAKAEVYMTINGDLTIDVIQRKPILRIINTKNESYYIDDEGKLMPLSEKYTARVLIANGNIQESYASKYATSVMTKKKSNEIDTNILSNLFTFAKFINANEFWKAQIQQVYVNQENELELIPRVGDNKIILGDVSDLDEKMKKLLTFYTEGMNTTGLWNKYSTINLMYKNQIVCTKKGTEINQPVVAETIAIPEPKPVITAAAININKPVVTKIKKEKSTNKISKTKKTKGKKIASKTKKLK